MTDSRAASIVKPFVPPFKEHVLTSSSCSGNFFSTVRVNIRSWLVSLISVLSSNVNKNICTFPLYSLVLMIHIRQDHCLMRQRCSFKFSGNFVFLKPCAIFIAYCSINSSSLKDLFFFTSIRAISHDAMALVVCGFLKLLRIFFCFWYSI